MYVTAHLKMFFHLEINHQNCMKKGSKSGPLKTSGSNLGFYTKNGPQNSWSPYFVITLWNQKSRNAETLIKVGKI